MNVVTTPEHRELQTAVAKRYQMQGFDVSIEPDPQSIPFDLSGYAPDLVARKGSTSLIIEVKTRADRASFDQLRSIAEEVKRHAGWRFILITAQDIPDELPGPGLSEPSEAQIARRIEKAARLKELGDTEAAFLAYWIAFELLLRLQARRVGLPLDRLSSSILIRQMYSQGELTMAQFDAALACQEIRNRTVHGFEESNLSAAVDRVETLVRELMSAISSPSS